MSLPFPCLFPGLRISQSQETLYPELGLMWFLPIRRQGTQEGGGALICPISLNCCFYHYSFSPQGFLFLHLVVFVSGMIIWRNEAWKDNSASVVSRNGICFGKKRFLFWHRKVDLTLFLLHPNIFPVNLVLQAQYFALSVRGYEQGKIMFRYFHVTIEHKSDLIKTRVN